MRSLAHIHPDPMPLREALRGLRHVMRRTGGAVVEILPVGDLPKPAADLAGAILSTAGDAVRRVDRAASDLAKTLLGGPPSRTVRLGDLMQGRDADDRFAQAAYRGLRDVLDRLGAPHVFVSEAVAREAFRAATPDAPAAFAAGLARRLLAARVLRGAGAEARVPAETLAPVAVTALFLWLLSDPAGDGAKDALAAATDLAAALAEEVALAAAEPGPARLRALLERYAPHV